MAIVGRLVERFGKSLEHDGRRFHAFPTAQVIAEARLDALRECGLSLRKAETLRQVASAMESGEMTEEKLSRMSSEEAIRFLTELKGIGPWSASLVLLRGLGRLDVFPPGDVGVARGLGSLMRLEARTVARSRRRALRRPAGLPLLLLPGQQPAGQGPHPRGSSAVLNRAPGGMSPAADPGPGLQQGLDVLVHPRAVAVSRQPHLRGRLQTGDQGVQLGPASCSQTA